MRSKSKGASRRTRRRARFAAVAVLVALAVALPATASASGVPANTRSYFEKDATPSRLSAQGERAGKAASQGIVILDFGRPAYDGVVEGTIGFGGHFVSFPSIAVGVERFVRAYFASAPSDTTLDVAVGTNDSCGTGQPCEGRICGCNDEPPSFATWGGALADLVISLNDWAASLRSERGYTDLVRVVAGDDAEPGFDPLYGNTFDLLEGYATVVGGYSPAMVDFGSADPHRWTEHQLLQVAFGFRPDVVMPEIYQPAQAAEWAALIGYAKRQGETVMIDGVLAGIGENAPPTAYDNLIAAIGPLTGQQQIAWLSTISH